MSLIKTDLLIKYFKIISLIILVFSNTNTFGAVSSFVGQHNWDESQQRNPTGVLFNPDGTKMYITGIIQNLSLIHI